jgi:hypothetical protein
MPPRRVRSIRNGLSGTASLILIAALTAPVASSSERDGEWELKQSETGRETSFELYTRDVEDSGYDRYRLEAVLDEPLERVIHAVQIRRSDDAYLGEGLERKFLHIDEKRSVSYIRMDLSMVTTRDVALESHWGFDGERGVYRDEWRTANDKAPPVPDGIVRMTKSEGFWELTPVSEGRTLVVYESYANPGGYIPGWIASSVLTKQVVEQIVTLRKILLDERIDVAAPPRMETSSTN